MIHKLSELINKAKNKQQRRIAVAAAEDEAVLKSLKTAMYEGIVAPILIGNKAEIEKVAKAVDLNLNGIEIVHNEKGADISAQIAVSMIKKGEANILMKGFVNTGVLLKAVLDKENGLRKGGVLSHVAFFESPYYHKFLCVTDAAMNVAPDFDTKVHILNNAVDACRKIGIVTPKVAVIAAIETVNPKMEATVHAAMMKTMSDRKQFKNCIVDGPLAIDNAVDKRAAEHKGIVSNVAGDCDIMLVPDIEAGNVLYKTLNFLGGATAAAVIMGAAVPIVLTSRSDTEESKMLSIALAAAMD
ncbi:MAG: bifunctional enoyl-CoA hydratase/phosphate acetyltransferase [Dysgonamonadaceae bacterium]|jgi:phosphate butyryltransferase|nr:bifunctional enoyl-CoA hydratase/phosphate acetyltransferase [Dysgonamonadaceae bacterium]